MLGGNTMSMKNLAVAVDLWGTHLRAALVDANGKILRREMKPVGIARTEVEIVKAIGSLVRVVAIDGSPLRGVGIGIPGLVDGKKGVVFESPHFPDWKNVSFAQQLQEELRQPVTIDNDANAAALGEQWLGAGKDFASFVMLTLGTGIGGALVLVVVVLVWVVRSKKS